jgi:hypothetical protein
MRSSYLTGATRVDARCRVCTRDLDAADQPFRTHIARLCFRRSPLVSRPRSVETSSVEEARRLAEMDPATRAGQLGICHAPVHRQGSTNFSGRRELIVLSRLQRQYVKDC